MGCSTSAPAGHCSVKATKTEIVESPFHQSFHLQAKLGKGSYAQVYRAETRGAVQEALAVKVVDLHKNPSARRTDGDLPHDDAVKISVKRVVALQREVEMMERLRSEPLAVRLHSTFVDDGLQYMVMELCEVSLFDAWDGLDLTESTLRPIIRGMLQAVSAVHSHAMVHRDVKPDNFVVTLDGTVKLCDFGLAAISDQEDGFFGVCGTPPYMAPEMLLNQAYGLKVDVWSLGVVAYLIVFGRFPYMPESFTQECMKQSIIKGALLDVESTHISAAMSGLLRELLYRVPAERASADSALRHEWLARDEAAAQMCDRKSSLRHRLLAAKDLGVFGARRWRDSPASPLDAYLVKKQEQAGLDASSLMAKSYWPSTQSSSSAASRRSTSHRKLDRCTSPSSRNFTGSTAVGPVSAFSSVSD